MIVAALLTASTMMAQEKTAVVNWVDLVKFHPNRQRDLKLLQDTEKEYQGKIDKQRDRIDQLHEDWQKAVKEARNPALNDKARAEAEDKAVKVRDVLSEADRDLRQEGQKYERELGELNSRLLRQVTGEIREVIGKFAQDGKYTVILDGTTMAYFDPKLDVTDEILKRIGVDPKVRKEAKEKEKTETTNAAKAEKK
jgi:Skp family chaperone for outer membrane proteins